MPYRLERSFFIPKPRAEVFAFFSDAYKPRTDNARIPPFPYPHTPAHHDEGERTLIDYELRLYGVRFKWQTRIEEFEPIAYFTDVQSTGPYRRWHHRHEFEEAPGGTQMRDRVEYEMPLGPWGAIVRQVFVRRELDKIFDHRNATITEIFTKESISS